MAPNFCANCGEKVIPEQKFCPNYGITGGVIGALMGAIIILFVLSFIYTGEYSEGPHFLEGLIKLFGVLVFSVIGALGAAQKLDSRTKVNAGGLFLAGIVVLVCMLSIATWSMNNPNAAVSSTLFSVFFGLIVSVPFFLSGYLLLRKLAS